MKVLLTDCLFPLPLAKWRLYEIFAFIDKYKCDIYITETGFKWLSLNSEKSITDNFNYIMQEFNLIDYDILIFNKAYNYLNIFNKRIDGTKYNNKGKGDYLFLHKNNNEQFNIKTYDVVYHIFINMYKLFNNLFDFPINKQFIHFYPGGGAHNISVISTIDKNANLIITQNYFNEHNKNQKYINVYGACFFKKHEVIVRKKKTNNFLTICFASMGHKKGETYYLKIVDKYFNKYLSNTKFISIGNCPKHQNIVHYDPMPQSDLDIFYKDNVDVYINLDEGIHLNGFPLGVESAIIGCVLLTTDPFKQNISNNFNINDFHIVDLNNLDDIVEKIHQLTDKNFLNKKSIYIQDKMYELFNYDNAQQPIFDFIEQQTTNNK